MNQRACGCRTLQTIQIGPISDVRTMTLKKSVAFSCGLIACRNRRREKEKRVVRRRESHQKEVKENETIAQDVKLSLRVTKMNRNNVQLYIVKNIKFNTVENQNYIGPVPKFSRTMVG